jgi:sucrose phosphorylase
VILLACQNATIRKHLFSILFYQPFSSDLDRGFSIINYDINELVSKEDLAAWAKYHAKFDIVLNQLSLAPP